MTETSLPTTESETTVKPEEEKGTRTEMNEANPKVKTTSGETVTTAKFREERRELDVCWWLSLGMSVIIGFGAGWAFGESRRKWKSVELMA